MTSAVFLASFLLYLASLAPTIMTDDVPEMVLAAFHLDIIHPPGYPLYALLGRLFLEIPAGAPAFRLNLLSAAAAAGAVTMLFGIARGLSRSYLWAAAGALALATSHTLWWQGTQADKYAVHLFLCLLLLRTSLHPRAGLPALAVPNGFGRNGLPTSLQLLGRAFSEPVLIAIADRYQQATDWHRRRPSL